ncbi:MAG TPA: cation diffusion facilitator family transporter [Chloroflexota bacterium]|nr:cation diffusion facilitator family transporter [Chloroflexota bacterium]
MVHQHRSTGERLRLAFFLTLIILAIELAGGVLSHSLALLSDAGHVFTDIIALGLAWFAAVQAGRPADASRTFGYHRTGILAALANAATLIAIVAIIAVEAINRLQNPVTVTPGLMAIAAAAGIAVNLYIGYSLTRSETENLNVRAATLHVFGDVASSGAVIAGAVVVYLTGWYPIDPLISLFVAAVIARGAWSILRDTLRILMESAPSDLDVSEMVADMRREPGIESVHDLHVWSLAGGMTYLTAHVQVTDGLLSQHDRLVGDLDCLLRDKYRIGHTTLQLESVCCPRADLYCDPQEQVAPGSHDH